jgi:hypothetical protein
MKFSEEVKRIGGLTAVVAGVAGVVVVAVVAIAVGGEAAATVAGSTAAVIGSMVGAFFGVKIGTDQTRNAVEAQREEATKAQVFAAHIPQDQAGAILEQVKAAAAQVRGVV